MSSSYRSSIHATAQRDSTKSCDDNEIAADSSRKQHFCVQEVVIPRLDVCLHDTAGCQTGCQTGLTTG